MLTQHALTHDAAFAAALLDPGRPLPAGIVAPTGAGPTGVAPTGVTLARRFAVYRNNVVVGLIAALRTRFPAVERVVGEEFFAAMARVFATEHPPRSPLMMTYGDGFADFIARFAPASELPYLPDVARLEAARTRAYHAADRDPLPPLHFATLAPDALAGTRIALHPSLAILRSPHPVVTIWAMNAGAAELAPIEAWRPEDALIARPRLDVVVRRLPPGGAVFLAALAADHSLAAAAASALADNAGFDLAANLAGLIGSGIAVDIIPSPSEELP